MTTHLEKKPLNPSKTYLQLVALIAIASMGGFLISGCTSDSTENEDQDSTQDGGVGSDDDEIEADCTPSDWVDPGTVPNPEVVAVATDAGITGKAFGAALGLEEYDYVEEEFFFSNDTPEPFTTRILVRRPRDPAKFSGTVYLEWLNVSGMMDVAVMWGTSRDYFMREGHIHIGVSAQVFGANMLKTYDEERYASINLPNDGISNAVFSQAAMAIRSQTEAILGECMPVDEVYAVGQSQSAMRLKAYVDSAQTTFQIFDGFLIHSGPLPASNDPDVPVIVIHTMTEGNCGLEDGPNMVCWAVAGASHNDDRIMTREIEEVGSAFGMDEAPFKCLNPLNQYPAWRVYNAALDWLNRWVRKGEKPPAGEPFEGNPAMSAVDANGNALGGVRLPDLDVPIATHNLENAPDGLDILGMMACGMGGSSVYLNVAYFFGLTTNCG